MLAKHYISRTREGWIITVNGMRSEPIDGYDVAVSQALAMAKAAEAKGDDARVLVPASKLKNDWKVIYGYGG